MAEGKKYYWLKLKNDFFNNREIKKLRRVSGGDTFTIIYLKMQLLSIQQGGLIKYMETEENLAEQLSLELDEAIEDVKLTLAFLQSNALIENISKDEYLLNKVPELIGSETSAAERMRKMRNRNNVTPLLQNVTQRKELENREELDIELEEEKKEEEKPSTPRTPKPKPTKHKYGQYKKVLLTDSQYKSLEERLGVEMRDECIAHLDNYCEANGKSYKNYYQAILNWVVDAVKERQRKSTKPNNNSGGNVFVSLGQSKGVF